MQSIMLGIAIFISSAAISLGIVTAFLLQLPVDHFQEPESVRHHTLTPIDYFRIFFRNLLGLTVVLLGMLLSLPGVPGQGFLTMAIGIMIMDFPGKKAFERRIMRLSSLLSAANAVRRRFGKAPFNLTAAPDISSNEP